MQPSPIRRAFTLIELLIVVAIIAILAAIAVPNFLEAQVRAKVSRARADMQTITTALETYKVDNNEYPMKTRRWPVFVNFISDAPWNERLIPITTPISYLTSLPGDPFDHFIAGGSSSGLVNNPNYRAYVYARGDLRAGPPYTGAEPTAVWNMSSAGPDNNIAFDTYWSQEEYRGFEALNNPSAPARYDPTNGTISQGDLVRWGPGGTSD
jgi:type II secretion system protein G